MLSKEDNELLSKVSGGTPGGEVIRHFWLPFLLYQELPEVDCIPLRVRLLGEDLIAFRDSDGQVGLLEDYCAHRGASLFFGRNEDGGLRCVYHGWKYDVTGQCVDMPAESPESNFHDKVRIRSYPCRERNGIVWTYMGRESPPPPLPELDWNMVPEEQAFVSKRVQFCNWFQALEGGIDSTHSDFIHSLLPGELKRRNQDRVMPEDTVDQTDLQKYRHFETVETPYGVMIGNSRPVGEEILWRINHFAMPFYTLFPPRGGPDSTMSGFAWVPIDDEHTLVMHWTYHPTRPLTEEQRKTMTHTGGDGTDAFHLSIESRLPTSTEAFGAWLPKQRRSNDYMIDYEAQHTIRFSGIPGGWNQDAAVQESMGGMANRQREHLGTADSGLIAARRRFLKVARAFRDQGQPPAFRDEPSLWRIRPVQALLDRHEDWIEAMKPLVDASKSKAIGPASQPVRGGPI